MGFSGEQVVRRRPWQTCNYYLAGASGFMRRPSAGGRIVGVCKLLKVGKRQAVGEVLLYSEGDPAVVAHAIGTYSIPPAR